MFIIVEWVEGFNDVMLAMNEKFETAVFKTGEEAEAFAKENCSAIKWKVVEI